MWSEYNEYFYYNLQKCTIKLDHTLLTIQEWSNIGIKQNERLEINPMNHSGSMPLQWLHSLAGLQQPMLIVLLPVKKYLRKIPGYYLIPSVRFSSIPMRQIITQYTQRRLTLHNVPGLKLTQIIQTGDNCCHSYSLRSFFAVSKNICDCNKQINLKLNHCQKPQFMMNYSFFIRM